MSDRLTPVLDAVRLRIAQRAFTLSGEPLPVVKRKATARRQALDPAAMITVSKSATPERTTRRRWGMWQTAYVIDVVVHAPYAGPDADTSEYSLIRDTIVDDFLKPPLAGAADVFDMDCQSADWLRPFGETIEYDWFSAQITATVAHEG